MLAGIYSETFGYHDMEYYLELVEKEVLTIPVCIDILAETDARDWAFKIIEAVSEEMPMKLYPYADYILEIFRKRSGFSKWMLWKTIVNLLPYDSQNIWENVEDEFYSALSSDHLAEFSIACTCVEKVITYKPNCKEKILSILHEVEFRRFLFNGDVSVEACKVAKEKAEILLKKIC